MSLNKVFLLGRFTSDVELRYTNNGTAVTSFSLAVDRGYKDQSGEKATDFIECVAWRCTAEFAARNFGKGRAAVVEGHLQVRPYTDKEGKKRNITEVVVDGLSFADSKPKQQTMMVVHDPNDSFVDEIEEDEDTPF